MLVPLVEVPLRSSVDKENASGEPLKEAIPIPIPIARGHKRFERRSIFS